MGTPDRGINLPQDLFKGASATLLYLAVSPSVSVLCFINSDCDLAFHGVVLLEVYSATANKGQDLRRDADRTSSLDFFVSQSPLAQIQKQSLIIIIYFYFEEHSTCTVIRKEIPRFVVKWLEVCMMSEFYDDRVSWGRNCIYMAEALWFSRLSPDKPGVLPQASSILEFMQVAT